MTVPTALFLAASTTAGGPPPPPEVPVPPDTASESFSDLLKRPPSIEFVDQYIGRAYEPSDVLRLDAPAFVESAKPGLFTLLREVRTGRKLPIDYSDYYEELDPVLRDLNRSSGIYYRDPCYRP